MFLRLNSIASQENEDSLPDTIDLTEEEAKKYVDLWLWWRATDKRFLPSQLVDEPNRPMANILQIDNYFERIVRQLKAQDNGEQGDDKTSDTA